MKQLFKHRSEAGGVGLILALVVGAVGIVVVGALIGFWLFTRLWIGFTISDQPIALQLPATMDASAKATRPLSILMDGVLHAKVPFNQDLVIPFEGRYDADVSFAAIVPVKFTITYDGVLPVDTMASIELDLKTVHFAKLKELRNLTIKAQLPLKLNIPVHLTVPVNVKLPFAYAGPLAMNIHQKVKTHVNTTLNTSIRVNQKMTTPVYGTLDMHINMPDEPIRAVLNHANLFMRIKTLGLELAEDPDRQLRVDNPWGYGRPPADSTTSTPSSSEAAAAATDAQ